MVSHSSTADHKRIWKRDLLVTVPKNTARYSLRNHREGPGQRETRPGVHAFTRVCEWNVLGFLRPDWPIKTKRVGFWQVPQGSYLRMPKGSTGKQKRCKDCWESHSRNLQLLVTLWAVIKYLDLHEGLVSVWDLCRALGQTLWMLRE